MKDERKRGWYFYVIGLIFVLYSILVIDSLPDYEVTDNYGLNHPEYHYAVFSSRLGMGSIIIGTIVWLRDNWILIKSSFATKPDQEGE